MFTFANGWVAFVLCPTLNILLKFFKLVAYYFCLSFNTFTAVSCLRNGASSALTHR